MTAILKATATGVSRTSIARELAQIRLVLSEREGDRTGLAVRLDYAAEMLGRLGGLWRAAGLEARTALVGSIWPVGLEIAGGCCRTLQESPLIALFSGKTQKMKDAGLTLETSVLFGSPGRT